MERIAQVVDELHKPARRNFLRRKVEMRGIDDNWQADLVEMIPYSQQNKGYKYLLTCIDNFSKFAWVVPIKSKTGQDVTAAMESILKQGRIPRLLHVDRGKEFYNKQFQALMDKHKIKLFSSYSNVKASIIERYNRTLKNMMWKHFTLKSNQKWLDLLPELVDKYNDTKHRTIGMKPNQVNASNEAQLMKKFPIRIGNLEKPKLKVGDKVRISKFKHIFAKGYTPNWTTEIFTIVKVIETNPVMYYLKDYQDEPVLGGFYQYELSKVKYPDVFLIDKIVRKRGNKAYVKWLGFDDSHNTWEDQSAILIQ